MAKKTKNTEPKPKKTPKLKSSSRLKDTKFLFILIAVIAVVAFSATLILLGRLIQTETYYVLNEDVGPRVQIAPEQLDPITTSEGSAPPNALTIADVQTGGLYTQYPLRSGDIITESSVGALSDISLGIPDSWVVTSFGVPADNAVGGRITRGTYFDIIGINDQNEAFYIFSNMLALDTTVSMDGASSAEAVDSEEARDGMTEQYYVGLSPENAAMLQSAVNQYQIYLVLSPRENEYEDPDTDRLEGFFNYDADELSGVPEVGSMTDNSFTPVERDEEGRPLEAPAGEDTDNDEF